MPLSEPTLDDEVRGSRLRSLRIFVAPTILALALYAFYIIGGYNNREAPPKPPRHGNIYGTVIDEKQRPVSGAAVTISYSSSTEPMPFSAPNTDKQGHFYLEDLPFGTYVLQATADGFNMQTQSMFVKPGKTIEVKIPLYHHSVQTRPQSR
jgi:hypothetical protein